ncbi:hypothetical protein CRYUN_Cryun14cG0045600 [Craigia yunnanensis]
MDSRKTVVKKLTVSIFLNQNSLTGSGTQESGSSKGRSGNGLQVFRLICLSIAVPCGKGIAVFACCLDSRRCSRENSTQRSTGPSVLPQPTLVATGLNESTIESYQKLVLGESRRIPGLNNSTCPICLSEYLSKETIRCIPECKHYFHAECVDERLRMNTTCPVCRNSPSADDASLHTDIV